MNLKRKKIQLWKIEIILAFVNGLYEKDTFVSTQFEGHILSNRHTMELLRTKSFIFYKQVTSKFRNKVHLKSNKVPLINRILSQTGSFV